MMAADNVKNYIVLYQHADTSMHLSLGEQIEEMFPDSYVDSESLLWFIRSNRSAMEIVDLLGDSETDGTANHLLVLELGNEGVLGIGDSRLQSYLQKSLPNFIGTKVIDEELETDTP